jgi:hypothetical protein
VAQPRWNNRRGILESGEQKEGDKKAEMRRRSPGLDWRCFASFAIVDQRFEEGTKAPDTNLVQTEQTEKVELAAQVDNTGKNDSPHSLRRPCLVQSTR